MKFLAILAALPAFSSAHCIAQRVRCVQQSCKYYTTYTTNTQ
jgi:hypothetical protein